MQMDMHIYPYEKEDGAGWDCEWEKKNPMS